MTAEWTKNFT